MGTLLGGKTGEGGKGVAPHGVDVIAQFRQAFGVKAEVVAGPPAFLFQQARGLQDLKVLRYRRPADRQLIG
jgi:hypothetical protein